MYTGTLISDMVGIDPTEKRPMVGTFFNLAPETHDRMIGAAKEIGVPVSEFCRTAIRAFLADIENQSENTEVNAHETRQIVSRSRI